MFTYFHSPRRFLSPEDAGGAPAAPADPAPQPAADPVPAPAAPAPDPQPAAAQQEPKAPAVSGGDAQARLIESELRAAAALAGVPKERLPYMLRMADRTGMDAEGADLSALAEAAVAKVLSDVPGLGGGGTGSPAAPPRIPTPDPDKMSDKEYYAYIAQKK